LCGVYFTDHSFFLTVIEEYKNRSDYVEIMIGCVIMDMRVSRIVESNAPDVVRLSSPKQTIREWLKKNRAAAKNGYLCDIIGGGYPSSFRMR
jgi:hypothetical protein